jgi:hypothetical protein
VPLTALFFKASRNSELPAARPLVGIACLVSNATVRLGAAFNAFCCIIAIYMYQVWVYVSKRAQSSAFVQLAVNLAPVYLDRLDKNSRYRPNFGILFSL